jgi:hypothetical protein
VGVVADESHDVRTVESALGELVDPAPELVLEVADALRVDVVLVLSEGDADAGAVLRGVLGWGER